MISEDSDLCTEILDRLLHVDYERSVSVKNPEMKFVILKFYRFIRSNKESNHFFLNPNHVMLCVNFSKFHQKHLQTLLKNFS